jgi:hypothetical protein
MLSNTDHLRGRVAGDVYGRQPRLAPDGSGGVEACGRARVRGHVAKDEASVYEGGPTRRWLKVKQKGWTVEEDRSQRRIFGEERR